MKYLPENDGIDHINVYSQGRTQLGRLLSNFANTPFRIPFMGEFESVEGFWYWVLTGNDWLKSKYGFVAKQFGKECLTALNKVNGNRREPIADMITPRLLKIAYRAKLRNNPDLKLLLKQNSLPLTHYYVFGGKQVTPKEFQWTAELWNELK